MRYAAVMLVLVVMVGAAPLLSGCATVGRDFSSAGVSKLDIGETTKAEVRDLFGPPWRVGVEDGHDTWTYGLYHYRVFGETETEDLLIRFDENNRVSSYTYNITNPDSDPN